MRPDIRILTDFYQTPIGQAARRTIARRLRAAWPALRGMRVLGLGFAIPYLRAFHAEAERTIAFMPARQGVIAWPDTRPLSVLGNDVQMPFPDAMFDRILVVHGLEGAEAVRPLMRQMWRVLAPEGRILIVAPNRASLWSQIERSPFAQGTPFLRSQLDVLLRESMFRPEHWDSALFFPPLKGRSLVRGGQSWERLGRALWPRLGGVHLVEASKSLVALARNSRAQPSGALVWRPDRADTASQNITRNSSIV